MKTISTGTTFNEIYQQYRPWLYQMANKIDKTHLNREDLVQCGRIGIAISMAKWDPARGSFFNCMYTYVRNEMMKFMEQHSNFVRKPASKVFNKENPAQPTDYVVSLDDLAYSDGNEALYSTIAYEESDYKETDLSLLKQAILQLKPQWQTIINMSNEEKTLTEISEFLGISKQAVSQQKANAIKELRKIMIK